jgi:hypothetical protein
VAVILAARLAARLFQATAEGPYGDRAAIVALSEDLQHKIVDERRGAGSEDAVLSWDARAYRAARTRLRARDPARAVDSALSDLDEARASLNAAWRFARSDPRAFSGDVADALQAHAAAIERFADAAAIFVRVSWQPPRPDGAAA